jgi:3-phytase
VPPPAGGPVTAIAETDPVAHSGDAADDPAIWVHPTNRALSTIIGTDKLGALEVYDLSGRRLHRYAVGDVNNVDLRYRFALAGGVVDLVVASDQITDSLRIFRVDPVSRGLVEISANGGVDVGLGIAGLCMYRSPTDGSTYVFDADSSGRVQQWRLNGTSDGTVTGTLVRSFTLSSVTEGCVADDDHGALYIAQEDVAIWRYGAEPNAGTTRTQVDTVSGGRLVADIEGLAIYYRGDGSGYLIASSQGDDSYAIYERASPHRFVGRFQVVAGVVDGVSHTDGLDVVSVYVGPTLTGGLLVVQDDSNTGGNQNFKLVPWAAVAANVGALTTGLGWDPRAS